MCANRERGARRGVSLLALCVGLSTYGVGMVHAAPPQNDKQLVEGHVVAVQGEDVIVDLAGKAGAKGGDVVELWRPIVLKHPVTRKQVRDRFLVGVLELVQVRDTLAIAHTVDAERAPRDGDIVVLRKAPPAVAEPTLHEPAVAPPPLVPVLPADCEDKSPEATHVALMFRSLSGASLAKRVAAYDSFVQQHPRSRYSRTLKEEAAMLRRAYRIEADRRDEPTFSVRSFSPPTEAVAGAPLTIAIEMRGKVRGALLHTRKAGDTSYASWPMKKSGRGYYTATMSAKAVHAGGLEYFIEATDKKGAATPVVGTGIAPKSVDVADQPTPNPLDPYIATLAAWSDYADYNRLRGNDVAWQTEGYFGMRFSDTGMRAVRTGFGVFRGVGGTLEDLDEHGRSGRKIGLTYGYIETEFGFHHFVGLAVRGVVGLEASGVTGGGLAFIRIGNDLETNLQLGGEILGGVGIRGIAQLELNIFRDWPMMVRTEVTNQPAGAATNVDEVRPQDAVPGEEASVGKNDIGGRAIVQVGYRIVDPLTIAIRGSYQGRTIKHSGPGLGGAVSYSW